MAPGQTKLVLLVLCAVSACGPSASGGAVELSWKLRPDSGDLANSAGPFINCDSGEPLTNPVKYIELSWQVGDQKADPVPFWDCNDGHGVTGFDLPAGTALITIAPVCTVPVAGTDAGVGDPLTWVAPAPIERQVIVGDTISLGAVELVLQVSSCDQQACICHPLPPS